jgi:hypothetical protein
MKKIWVALSTISLIISCEKNDDFNDFAVAELSGEWVSMTIDEEVPLGAVWGNSECLYAVGGALGVDPSVHLGTILKNFNGQWVIEKGDFNSRLVLLGISGVSCNEIYVIGEIADGVDRGILLMYNGAEWEEIRTDVAFTNIEIIGDVVYITAWDGVYKLESGKLVKIYDSTDFIVTDIWGINDKLYLIGYSGERDYILKYDGETWNTILEGEKFQENFLDNIEGISENEIYATGTGGRLLKYNGSTWEIVLSELLPIGGFKIFESKELYIATSRHRTGNKIYRYSIENGELEIVFEADIPFYGLWGSPNVGIYAVGLDGTIVHNDILK